MSHGVAERAWRQLIERLASDGAAAEVEPGRIRAHLVDANGRRRRVDLLMTPEEWEEIALVITGSADRAIDDVRARLRALPLDHGFLVHRDCELVASTTPDLPPDDWTGDLPEPASAGLRRSAHPDGR